MNSDTFEGKWKQVRGAAKERWGKLTDDDLDVIDGKREQLVGKVQERYGVARDAAEKQVEEWNKLHDSDREDQRREADRENLRKVS